MAKIISVVNQKGGVGKTTTTINLSSQLCLYSKSILVIDIDPQSNTTSGFGLEKNKITNSIYNILIENLPLSEVILPNVIDWLDLIPSNLDLIGAEIELVSKLSRETILKNVLVTIKESYDYIFIDCPPSLGLLTLNALTASDSIIIPIQCEYLALEGLAQLLQTINLINQNLNKNLEIEGVLLTMYDSRINLGNEVVKEIKKFFGDKVYKTIIPRNVRLAEAPSFGKPILLYDKYSKGGLSYCEFAEEFLNSSKILKD